MLCREEAFSEACLGVHRTPHVHCLLRCILASLKAWAQTRHIFPTAALSREGAGHTAQRPTVCPTGFDGRAWGHLLGEHILGTLARHRPEDWMGPQPKPRGPQLVLPHPSPGLRASPALAQCADFSCSLGSWSPTHEGVHPQPSGSLPRRPPTASS